MAQNTLESVSYAGSAKYPICRTQFLCKIRNVQMQVQSVVAKYSVQCACQYVVWYKKACRSQAVTQIQCGVAFLKQAMWVPATSSFSADTAQKLTLLTAMHIHSSILNGCSTKIMVIIL